MVPVSFSWVKKVMFDMSREHYDSLRLTVIWSGFCYSASLPSSDFSGLKLNGDYSMFDASCSTVLFTLGSLLFSGVYYFVAAALLFCGYLSVLPSGLSVSAFRFCFAGYFSVEFSLASISFWSCLLSWESCSCICWIFILLFFYSIFLILSLSFRKPMMSSCF